MRQFADDMASGRRILAQATVEKKLSVFTDFAREGVRWHTVGGMLKTDVADALTELGIQAGLDADEIQAALAAAVDDPFIPSNRSSIATPRRSNDDHAELVIRRVSDIEPKPVRWLWPNRLPLGKV